MLRSSIIPVVEKRSSSWIPIRNSLILLLLLTLILAPRLAAGGLDLARARRFEAAGHNADAAAAYAQAAQRIPWQPSLWEKAGINAQLGGDAQNAVVFMNKAIGREAISRQGWLSLGVAYQQLGDVSSAVNAWEQALPLAEAYRSLAQAERGLGDFQSAVEHWRALLALEPGDAAAHYALGLLLTASAPESALPELMQAARLDPGLDASVQGLRTALNTAFLSDDQAYQFLLSGRALAALCDWDLAAEAFQKAIAANPGYAEAWAWLGEAKQHRDQDGSAELLEAVTLEPNSAMIQALYGIYFQRLGLPEKALEAYRKAADLEPQNDAWQIALGSAYQQKGDLIAAYNCYLRAVELSPQDVIAWRALATFSVNNGVDIASTGQAAIEKLLALAPDDWQTYDLAGQVMTALEIYPQAETYLKRALELDATQPAPSLHLALVYLQKNDPSSAFPFLDQTKALDPDGPYGRQAGRLLEQYFP